MIKTICVYFGIVIEGLSYIIGLNVPQNQWRMAICRGGIITGELTWGEIFVAIREGGDITGGNIAGDHCISCVIKFTVLVSTHFETVLKKIACENL